MKSPLKRNLPRHLPQPDPGSPPPKTSRSSGLVASSASSFSGSFFGPQPDSSPTPQTGTRPGAPTKPKADTKAQGLLNELSTLLDEVYPPDNPAVIAERTNYLAQLASFGQRRATLTLTDRIALKKLELALEEVQATMASSLT